MDLIDIGLYVGYLVLIVATASAIVLPLINAIKNPAGLLKSAIGLIGVVVFFGVAYAMSNSEVTPQAASLGVTETGSKLISAGLILFYIALVISLVSLVYSEVSKALK